MWTIQVRLTGKKGEYLINKFDCDAPRTYKGDAGAMVLSTQA